MAYLAARYEEVYTKAYSGGWEAKAGIDDCFRFYNSHRPHQALGCVQPRTKGFNRTIKRGRWAPDRELLPYPGAKGLSLNLSQMMSKRWGPPYLTRVIYLSSRCAFAASSI